MTDEELAQRLAERKVCEADHAALMVPHNGFGWTGSRCCQCGFMYFGQWEAGSTTPSTLFSRRCEMGKVFASCTHEVASLDDLVSVEFDDEEIDHDAGCFVPITVLGSYCPQCAAEGLAEGRLRITQ